MIIFIYLYKKSFPKLWIVTLPLIFKFARLVKMHLISFPVQSICGNILGELNKKGQTFLSFSLRRERKLNKLKIYESFRYQYFLLFEYYFIIIIYKN